MFIIRGKNALLYENLEIFLDLWNTPSVNVDGSGKISQISDISGKQNHCKQPTASLRPAYVASGYNSKPECRPDGVDDWMKIEYEPNPIEQSIQVAEVFIICNYTLGATFGTFPGLFTSLAGTPTPFIVGQSGATTFEYEGFASGGSTAHNDFTAINGVPGFNFAPLSTMKLVNSQASLTAGTGGIDSINCGAYQLFKDRGATDRYWGGGFISLLAYSQPCSTAKRNYIGKYLADRFGLTIATLV